MKFLKKNMRVIIALILGIMLAGGIVYATTYQASDITYSNTNVSAALDDLYSKFSNEKIEITTNGEQTLEKYYNKLNVKVYPKLYEEGSISAPGQTYTFKNNGYIIGTMARTPSGGGGYRC